MRELQARLDRLESARPSPGAQDGAARGETALRRLGIDLGKLSTAELTRLETLALAWPEDGTVVNAAVIYAVIGTGAGAVG